MYQRATSEISDDSEVVFPSEVATPDLASPPEPDVSSSIAILPCGEGVVTVRVPGSAGPNIIQASRSITRMRSATNTLTMTSFHG
jgi:hypothetical protein